MKNRITELRKKNDIKQSELASILNIGSNTLCQYEKGDRQIPDNIKRKLCRFFNVSMEYLLGISDGNEYDSVNNIGCTHINAERLSELLIKAQGSRSQNQFAAQCGISSSAITRIINGDYAPSPNTLRKIANVSHNGVTYEDLLEACSYIDKRSGASTESEQQEDRNKYGNILMKFDIDYIKNFMKDNGITYADLSEKSKISLSTISKIMCGITPIPRYTTIQAIYSALGIGDKETTDIDDEQSQVPLISYIVPDVSIEYQQNIEKYIWINQSPSDQYFAVRVQGDGMKRCGVQENCILVVHKQKYANCGDLVVANFNKKTIVSRFQIFANIVFLMPANMAYDPIPVFKHDDLQILGKVVEIHTIL